MESSGINQVPFDVEQLSLALCSCLVLGQLCRHLSTQLAPQQHCSHSLWGQVSANNTGYFACTFGFGSLGAPSVLPVGVLVHLHLLLLLLHHLAFWDYISLQLRPGEAFFMLWRIQCTR